MVIPDNLPPITGGHAGPSHASDMGHTGEIGGMRVGDYYAAGSRRRQGWGSRELLVIGAVGLAGWWLWRRL